MCNVIVQMRSREKVKLKALTVKLLVPNFFSNMVVKPFIVERFTD